MTQKLRWGVLGAANIARAAVIPAILSSSNGTLQAIASRNEEKGRNFAAPFGNVAVYGSYEALLDDPQVDAVYIPLPNSLHREWAIRSAQAGKHILCEKPLALSANECEEMADAARQAGVRLMEAFMYRFHPRIEQTLQRVRAGTLGEIKMIQSAFTFRLTRRDNIRFSQELGGGALMDVGCYCVNFSRTIAGQEPEMVQAQAVWGATGVDEQLVGTLLFPNGLMAQFDCALTLERRETALVAGTDGTFLLPAAFLPGKEPVELIEQHGREGETRHSIAGVDEYQAMVEHFGEAVLKQQPFRYEVAEAAANLRVIEALYCSAREGGSPIRLSS